MACSHSRYPRQILSIQRLADPLQGTDDPTVATFVWDFPGLNGMPYAPYRPMADYAIPPERKAIGYLTFYIDCGIKDEYTARVYLAGIDEPGALGPREEASNQERSQVFYRKGQVVPGSLIVPLALFVPLAKRQLLGRTTACLEIDHTELGELLETAIKRKKFTDDVRRGLFCRSLGRECRQCAGLGYPCHLKDSV